MDRVRILQELEDATLSKKIATVVRESVLDNAPRIKADAVAGEEFGTRFNLSVTVEFAPNRKMTVSVEGEPVVRQFTRTESQQKW